MDYENVLVERLIPTYEELKSGLLRLIDEGKISREDAARLLPELRESEDERIRQGLLKIFKQSQNGYWAGMEIKDIVAYLEKQKINTEGDFGRGYDCGYQAGHAVAMNEMKPKVVTATLDSEKPSEGLEDILLEFYDEYDSNVENRPLIPRIYAEKLARHFAEWGAEHLVSAGKTISVKPGDEVTINGHKIVYDKDKGYVTIVKSEESVPNNLEKEDNSVAERFAKIVRANLTKIDKSVQSQFEQLYMDLTGNKMYGGYND